MTVPKELINSIGQLFVIGFKGATPPEPLLDFFREERIGGLILFEENCPTHAQVRENIEQVKSYLPDTPPFIAVDQEGGRVCRLRGAPAEFRPASSFASDDDVSLFKEIYSRSAVYLESLGINLNFAPVADLMLNEQNDWLKERSFGDNPSKVADFVRASVEVARESGLMSCLKHFPGLGASNIDPHNETSTADYDNIIWEQREKIPFEAGVRAGADMIMTTHMTIPSIDDKMVTVSEKIISDLARNELQFDGPIITDDLCMGGAEIIGSYG